MRIIAGDKKGLNLTSLKGDAVRPTTDKIRGAIFSMLGSLGITQDVFVDCFAGTGAMAIEALSRGFKEVYLFDSSKKSISIIKKNLELSGYEAEAKLYHCKALAGLEMLKGRKVDVFFMDPPYKKLDLIFPLLDYIKQNNILAENGVIMIEHDKGDIIIERIKDFTFIKEKKYGNTVITIFG